MKALIKSPSKVQEYLRNKFKKKREAKVSLSLYEKYPNYDPKQSYLYV